MATDSENSAARKRVRSPAQEVAQSTARSRARPTRRASAATVGGGDDSTAPRALAMTARSAAKSKAARVMEERSSSLEEGVDANSDDHADAIEIVRVGPMVNTYEVANMVKSELIAEFERRGEKLVEIEREAQALRERTTRAESLLAATTAEVEALRDMKFDHEKSKEKLRVEIANERQANMLALEREVDRACEAESRAKGLTLELGKLKEENKKLRESFERDERPDDSSDEDAGETDFSEKAAALECAIAEHRDEISNLKSEGVELKTSLRRAEAQREAETIRANQAEEALRECETLVAQAEATVLEIRKQLDESKSGSAHADGQSSRELNELRSTNKTLQEELRIAVREAAEVKTLRRKAEFAATCEERAMAAEARALRAEASVIDTSSMQSRLAKLEYLESDWASVVDRVSGGVKVPSDLVERVVTLETRLTAQAGDQGKMMSDLAQAQTNEATAMRRASEAEEKHRIAEASAANAIEALARAERKISVLTGERESLNRIIKSYEDEMNAAAAKKTAETLQSKAESGKAIKDLEKSLRAATERITALESELTEERAKTAVSAPMETQDNANDARVRDLERERDELARQLSSRDFDPNTVKVLHFKMNPVASARQSALEKEVESLRSEASGLREALTKMQDGSVTSASEADVAVWRRKFEDTEKRMNRLMTVFRRQTSIFREACHKIFGYKIDMSESAENSADERHVTFTLVSDYAEKPTDAFAFKFDEKASAVSLKSNAFVESPEVKRSVDTFITRLNSVPAFVANHTIDLFNRSDDVS